MKARMKGGRESEMKSGNPTRRIAQWLGSLLILVAGSVGAGDEDRIKGPRSETGDIGGAEFRIDIPEGWNGGLVMYAHGYETVGAPSGFNMQMVGVGKRLGFAVAQSKYSAQGWAAREGVLDTEALRRYFVDKYGETSPTIIAGHSQGAAITFKTIETYPEAYDGALPMCGTAEPALSFSRSGSSICGSSSITTFPVWPAASSSSLMAWRRWARWGPKRANS